MSAIFTFRRAAAALALAALALAALLGGFGASAHPAAAVGCGNTDGDHDGLTCYQEYTQVGTDDGTYDTDGDGWGDGDEVLVLGTDPLVYDARGDGDTDGGRLDTDGDGLSDLCDSAPLDPRQGWDQCLHLP